MKQRGETCKLCWLFILPVVLICAPSGVSAQQKEVVWLSPLAGWNGRVLTWPLGNAVYAIEQPITLQWHLDPDGSPNLVFVHSGYTAEDPDGKTAVLSVNLDTIRKALSPSDRQAVQNSGVVDDGLTNLTFPPNGWKIDLSLASNLPEEARIRKAIGMPVTVAAGGATMPIQIRWTGVGGTVLYGWLTDKDGVEVVLIGNGVASRTLTRVLHFDQAKLLAWFDKVSGGVAAIYWTGNSEPVLQSMLNFGCLEEASGMGTPISISTSAADYSGLLALVDGVVTRAGTKSMLRRVDLEGKDLHIDKQVKVTVPVSVQVKLQPGTALLQHPELVKDLSGNSTGLGAIRQH